MLNAPLERLHRFHPYCARFPSEVVEAALAEYTKPGDSVFDPFCGSGTTLVAGLAHKRKVVGCDIDHLAGMLSQLKCSPLSRARYVRWRAAFTERLAERFDEIERVWRPETRLKPGAVWSLGDREISIPPFPELNYWFPPQLIAALAATADAAHGCRESHYERTALISLSACIIAKWPNTLSYAKDVDHTRPHRELRRFTLGHILDTYRARLDRTIDCLATLRETYDAAQVPAAVMRAARVVYPHDAREPLTVLGEESQDLIMTSPPYFNAVDYPRAHRMSVCWMNGHAPAELASRRSYVGLHSRTSFDPRVWLDSRPDVKRLFASKIPDDSRITTRLTAFFSDLEAVLTQCWRVLRPGGHAVFVIANNVVGGVRIESHKVLARLATSLGYDEVATNHREIARLRRRFPVGPFGFDGPMTHEYIIVLRKPRRRSTSASGRNGSR